MMEEYRHLKIKLTPQRLAILSFLKGNKSHPSAEDIYKAVTKQFPTMSFATVYNTLEALRDKGNIQELKIDRTKKRYDPDISRHSHLICIKCSKISDIQKDFKIKLPEDQVQGFELLGNAVEFYGICSRCK